MTREELIKSNEFWTVLIQNKVFNLIENYRISNNWNKTQMAGSLGVSKGYVTQILNGDYDHKISKLVELALSCKKAPVLNFVDIEKYVEDDKNGLNIIDQNFHSNKVYVVSSKSVLQLNSNSEFATYLDSYFQSFNSISVPLSTQNAQSDRYKYHTLNYQSAISNGE